MRKITLGFLLFLLLGSVAKSQVKSENTKDQSQEFAIYLKDSGEMIFSEDNLEYYESLTFSFGFTRKGAVKMKSYQRSGSLVDGLFGKAFEARMGSVKIYEGVFWSGLSSSGFRDHKTIGLLDVVIVGPGLPSLRFSNSYPSDRVTLENKVKLNDKRLIDRFKQVLKLRSMLQR